MAAFLAEKVELAISLGVPAEKIIIDPGHDLNKNTLHTLEITRRFNEIAALGFPALAAVSNKDFIGETLDQSKNERLEGRWPQGSSAFSAAPGSCACTMWPRPTPPSA